MRVLSLFDGISCGRVAFERAGIPVSAYYASEIHKPSIQVTQKNYPDTIQLGDVCKVDGNQFKDIDILIGGSPCFRAGTLIMTDKGFKKIEDIQEGDYVLTHMNRFRKVVLKMVNFSNKIYDLKVQGSPTTQVTEEHPYYVRSSYRKWDNSRRMSVREFTEPVWKKVKDLDKGDFIGFPINTKSENTHKLTEEDCWLLGRYAADGHIRKDKRKGRENSYQYQVVYSVGEDKVDDFKQKVRARHFSCYTHTDSTYRCVIASKELVELIELLGMGNSAESKRIPVEILNLPIELAKAFLDGYMSGDGSFTKGKFSATSVSKELLFGIGQLVMKVYRVPYSLHFTDRPSKIKISGRVVNQKDTWQLVFDTELRKQTHAVVIGDYVWQPYREKTLLDLSDTVYNFEVEEDNSYVANNCIVHNCQGFSFAGKQLNFEDPRSKLFFEYVRILKETKPKYFLLENVNMKKEYQDIISKYLGIEPVMINSSLVSAQNRKRLYWTNIPDLTQPRDKGLFLKDIVHEYVDLDSVMSESWAKWFKVKADYILAKKYTSLDPDKAITMTARQYANWNGNFIMECLNEYIVPFDEALQVLDKCVQTGKMGYFRKDSQANRVYFLNNKAVTLCGDAGGGAAKMGQYLFGEVKENYFQYDLHGKGHGSQDQRAYYPEGKHGTLPSRGASSKCKVLFGEITPDAVIPGQPIEGIVDGQKFYTLTNKENRGVLIEGYIRKLTPIECERLQTLPDNYTEGISNAQRYAALGNGWTVDVIAHILSHIKE